MLEHKDGRYILALDSHSLSTFKQCEEKDHFSSVLNLRSKGIKKGLAKGTIWHNIHIYYYLWKKQVASGKRKENLMGFYSFLTKYVERQGAALAQEDKDIIVQRFFEYVKQKPDKYYEILAYEKGFSKLLYEDSAVTFIYEGKMDWIVRNAQRKLLWEDKKTQHPKFTRDLYTFVDQFMGYCWALGTYNGIIEYTTFSKKITDRTFRETIVSFSPEQIKQWEIDTINWFYRVLYSRIGLTRRMRNRSACDGKYGLCPYTTLCEHTDKTTQQVIINRDYIKGEPWRAW